MSTATRALFEFDDSYARALPSLSVPWRVSPVPRPSLLLLNGELADELGADTHLLRAPTGVALLAGNAAPDGVSPSAQAYSGHQFGGYVPRPPFCAGQRRDVVAVPASFRLGRTAYQV